MVSQHPVWVRRVGLLLFYLLAVVFLENLLLLANNDDRGDLLVAESRDWALHAHTSSPVGGRHLQANDSTVNSSAVMEMIVPNITDGAEMHLVQMHLSLCYQRKRDVIKCLAEAYRYASLADDGIKASAAAGRRQANRGRTPAPAALEKPDPKLEAAYYQRRPFKVNPYLYNYHTFPNACSSDTFMVILIHSFHPYKDRRAAIRDTWGGYASGKDWPVANATRMPVRLLFVLAKHSDATLNKEISEEASKYKDILIGDFMDAYPNMTLKSLLGLKWVSEQCSEAKYLLKSDDDMIINLPHIIQVLITKQPKRSIMGPLNSGSKVYRAGKWKVKKELYPFKIYPPYESGACYVISADIVRELYETAEYVPALHVDDVYITGILGKMLGVTHQFQKGFAYWTDKAPSICAFLTNKIVSGTKMTPSRLRSMWNQLAKGYLGNKCDVEARIEQAKLATSNTNIKSTPAKKS